MVSAEAEAPRVPSRDALRAALAESKLQVFDLTAQLRECDLKLGAGAGSKSVNEAVQKASDAQREQRTTIGNLTKEVNGLRQKTRVMEAHIDRLTEQERELRKTFDTFFTSIIVVVCVAATLALAHLYGAGDVLGKHVLQLHRRSAEL